MNNSAIYFFHGRPIHRTHLTLQQPETSPRFDGPMLPNTLSFAPLAPITQRRALTALCNTNQNTALRLVDEEESDDAEATLPSMSDILESSRAQNLDLQLQKLGPFFRIKATSLITQMVVGRAEGLIRVWLGGRLLHLDTIRLSRETLGMKRSIFGIGLFVGAVAVRYGYDCGCRKAELLAVNDSDIYHSKLVKFYTRIGFKPVYEVTGSSIGDLPHMLVWGGVGTRMDADVEALLTKWSSRFKSKT